MTGENAAAILVAIVGPTAAGKSALGVFLARQLGGEVVACDSTQLYRGFDIGTAKPSAAERCGVPHHLIDVLEPHAAATAGGYRQLALPVLEDLKRRKCLPIFTVGTGLYWRALLEGLADVPERSEQLRGRLRASAKEHVSGYLHGMLKRLDPASAAKIAPADEQKLIRAIEVCLLSRKPFSEVHRSGRKALEGWRTVKIGLLPPREQLQARINARTDQMLESGWLHEVQTLLDQEGHESTKPFDFIGYRELRSVLQNKLSLAQARTAIQQATRQYAKRQMTWFHKERDVSWFVGFGDVPALQLAVLEALRAMAIPTASHWSSSSVS